MKNYLVLLPTTEDDPLAKGWRRVPAEVRDLALNRAAVGLWESQVDELRAERGWTRLQIRNFLVSRGCTIVVQDFVEPTPADPNSGDGWKAGAGWIDPPAS